MSTNNHHSTGDQNDSDRAKLEQVLAASEDSEHANVASIHEHVAELLGAYAIHAVAEAEIEFVELHLDQCETCQVELAEHLSTAARIGAASVMPVAPRVWDNVLAEIRSIPVELSSLTTESASDRTPATLRSPSPSLTMRDSSLQSGMPITQLGNSDFLSTGGSTGELSGVSTDQETANTPSNVIDFATAKVAAAKRRTWRVAVAAAVATAAITVPIVSSFSGSSPSLAALAKRVAERPTSRSMTLRSDSGAELARIVVGQDRQGYLTSDSLPKLASGRAYQLWAVTDSGPVSLGMLGADPQVQAFAAPTTYAALAISVEDANGAATPTPPIASAAV